MMPSKAKPKSGKRSTLSEEEKAARRAERKAERDAEQKRKIQEWAKAEAAKAPPLTPHQISVIRTLLWGKP